ncbi:hypothetical protein TNCV_1073241 [Trichonephila clavipes]|nr:hypothetical protein TNCV_1073241 [Trichonephila clavipes]
MGCSVGRDPMAVSRIWNRCTQDGTTERRALSQRAPITSSPEDSHVIHVALRFPTTFGTVILKKLING